MVLSLTGVIGNVSSLDIYIYTLLLHNTAGTRTDPNPFANRPQSCIDFDADLLWILELLGKIMCSAPERGGGAPEAPDPR